MPAAVHRVGGEGPPLLLVHGFGSDRLGWAATSPALMDHFTVWAAELPAHGTAEPGETTVPQLANAVAQVLPWSDAPFAIVGHSLGGAVATQLVHDYPARFGKTVLLAPAGYGTGAPDVTFLQGFAALQSDAEAIALLERLVVRKRLILPQMAAYVLAHLAKPGIRKALAAIGEAATSFTPAPCPPDALVIWGSDDTINRPHKRWLDERGERSLFLTKIGHLPHVEAATKVNRAILNYLQP